MANENGGACPICLEMLAQEKAVLNKCRHEYWYVIVVFGSVGLEINTANPTKKVLNAFNHPPSILVLPVLAAFIVGLRIPRSVLCVKRFVKLLDWSTIDGKRSKINALSIFQEFRTVFVVRKDAEEKEVHMECEKEEPEEVEEEPVPSAGTKRPFTTTILTRAQRRAALKRGEAVDEIAVALPAKRPKRKPRKSNSNSSKPNGTVRSIKVKKKTYKVALEETGIGLAMGVTARPSDWPAWMPEPDILRAVGLRPEPTLEPGTIARAFIRLGMDPPRSLPNTHVLQLPNGEYYIHTGPSRERAISAASSYWESRRAQREAQFQQRIQSMQSSSSSQAAPPRTSAPVPPPATTTSSSASSSSSSAPPRPFFGPGGPAFRPPVHQPPRTIGSFQGFFIPSSSASSSAPPASAPPQPQVAFPPPPIPNNDYIVIADDDDDDDEDSEVFFEEDGNF